MTALVLAGGQSRRFGRDKARIKLDGVTVIERVVTTLRGIFGEIIIVGHKAPLYAEPGVKELADGRPGLGPLGGLYTGLRHSAHPWVFCCACDMPFLNASLIQAMTREMAEGRDAVVCRREGRLQPLHGLYATRCLPVIEEALEADERRMSDMLPRLRVKYLEEGFCLPHDPEGLSFFNLNTPRDLTRAVEILGREHAKE